jgi:hypothetical protein
MDVQHLCSDSAGRCLPSARRTRSGMGTSRRWKDIGTASSGNVRNVSVSNFLGDSGLERITVKFCFSSALRRRVLFDKLLSS